MNTPSKHTAAGLGGTSSEDQARRILARAMEDHRQGRLEEAERGYRQVLSRFPRHPDALHYLGVLLHQTQRSDKAIAMIRKALALAPGYADAHSNLGNVYRDLDQLDEAEAAYRACLALDPTHANGLNNLGVVLAARGRYEEAAEVFRQILELNPAHGEASYNLARALDRLGEARRAERAYREAIRAGAPRTRAHAALGRLYLRSGKRRKAIRHFRRWLEAEPNNEAARFLLAASTGKDVPERAADHYVATVFDEFAASFDATLEALDYRAPALVAEAIATLPDRPRDGFDLLDAGCGTGLLAPRISTLVRHLVGVDLSPEMVRRARSRGGYDELVTGELTAFLEDSSSRFHVVASADTLIYFGDLEPVVAAAHRALRPGGHVVFTLEQLASPKPGEAYRLGVHGRYSHAQSYVEECLAHAGFGPPVIGRATLRKESGADVAGLVVTAGRVGKGPET